MCKQSLDKSMRESLEMHENFNRVGAQENSMNGSLVIPNGFLARMKHIDSLLRKLLQTTRIKIHTNLTKSNFDNHAAK